MYETVDARRCYDEGFNDPVPTIRCDYNQDRITCNFSELKLLVIAVVAIPVQSKWLMQYPSLRDPM
jgi:hypothetical protein